MSTEEKAKANAKNLEGQAQEAVGDITGDRNAQAKGQAKQAEGKTRNAAENAKDAVENAAENVKDAVKRALD
jgi:uncharacterized protein YjbJ (UPF0337 family)